MQHLTLDASGALYAADARGLPALHIAPSALKPVSRPSVILINGFNFNPSLDNDDNPHRGLFTKRWLPHLMHLPHIARGNADLLGFGWFSAELKISSWVRAWLNGRYNPYRWGWDLAKKAAGVLSLVIGWDPGLDDPRHLQPQLPPVDIIAHSLGVRVALAALRQVQPHRIRRVLLLNGAEYSQTARVVAAYSQAEVLNVVVQDDDVLALLGRAFAPEHFIAKVVGRDGIIGPPRHWADVTLDDPQVQARAASAGWPDLEGNCPNQRSDHWYSYEHAPNWALFKSFLSGERSAATIAGIING
jgi:hypothetical protein